MWHAMAGYPGRYTEDENSGIMLLDVGDGVLIEFRERAMIRHTGASVVDGAIEDDARWYHPGNDWTQSGGAIGFWETMAEVADPDHALWQDPEVQRS